MTCIRQTKRLNCFFCISHDGALRHAENFPQKPFESLPNVQDDSVYQGSQSVFGAKTIIADRYLLFLTKKLKPIINKTYPTKSYHAIAFLTESSRVTYQQKMSSAIQMTKEQKRMI